MIIEPLTSLCLNLLRIAELQAAQPGAALVIAWEEALADLAEAAPEARPLVAEALAALTQVPEADIATLHKLTACGRLMADRAVDQPEVWQRVEQLDQAFRRLLSLSLAVNGEEVQAARITVVEPSCWHYIRTWRFEETTSSPALVLVSRLGGGETPLRVEFRRHTPRILERGKLYIDYLSQSPFPLLTLHSRYAEVVASVERTLNLTGYRQKDTSVYDVSVEDRHNRWLGRIRTRTQAWDGVVQGGQLTVNLAAQPGQTAVTTTVEDTAGQAVAVCVRLYPTPGVA